MSDATYTDKTNSIIDFLKRQYRSLQIGRASAGLVSGIEVESYGSMMKLEAVASISTPDSKTIRIEPWDTSLCRVIEDAIVRANIGIMPQNMGEYILLPIPAMTEERRVVQTKKVKEMAENSKISVRAVRHEWMESIKKQKDTKEISEDEAKIHEKKIEKCIHECNNEIDQLEKEKEKEIMTI